jgi:hypothetical protein
MGRRSRMFLMIPQRRRVTELVETRLLCYRCGFEGHRTDLVKLPAVPRLPAAETNAYLDVRQPEGIWQSPNSPKPKGIGLLRKKKSVVGRRAKRGPGGSCCQSSIYTGPPPRRAEKGCEVTQGQQRKARSFYVKSLGTA